MNKEIKTKEDLLELMKRYKTNDELGEFLGKGESSVRRLKKKFKVTSVQSMGVDTLKDYLSKLSPLTILPQRQSDGETLVIHLTDWHIGSMVKDEKGVTIYNISIARKRAELLCQKIIYLVNNHISQGTKLTDIVVFITGDMADGELVYDTQIYQSETAPPKQVMTTVEILIQFLKTLLKTKLPIRLYAVKGNHGLPKIAGIHPESNWDLMIYMILEFWMRSTQQKNLSIEYAEGDYLNVTVRDWIYHLRHKGISQTETAAGGVKAGGWSQIHNCDALVFGHLHHFSIGEWVGLRTFMSGSLKGIDDFAEGLAKGANPTQTVWGTTNKHISTFIYVVDLN
jgi:predicted phosphodiesterase